MKKFLFMLIMLASCANVHQDPPEEEVVAAVYEGWEQAIPPLPEFDEKHIHTERFKIEYPDVAEYNKLCYPGTTKTSNGCFKWRLLVHPQQGTYSVEYPAAIIDPTIDRSLAMHLGIHELLHGIIDRTLKRPRADPYDKDHTDPRVWAGLSETSAESIAQDVLDK